MKAILHIGIEKTGSTTLQDFIFLNKEEFNKNNIYIANTYYYSKSHWHLGFLAYDDDKNDSFILQNKLIDKEKRAKYKEKLLYELKQEFKGKENVLFTCELIHSRLTSIDEINRLKEVLIDFGFDEFVVIFYIREQVSLLQSLYQEAIKWDEIDGEFNVYDLAKEDDLKFVSFYKKKMSHFHFICNHLQTINNYEKVFGKEALKINIFEKNHFKNNNLISDFLYQLNLNQESFTFCESSNISLNLQGVKLLSKINKYLPQFIDNNTNKNRVGINAYFNMFFKSSFKYCIFSEEEVAFIKNFYEKDNEIIKNKYFPKQEKLFLEEKFHFTDKNTDDNLEIIAQMLAKILSDKNSKINELNVQIINLQKQIQDNNKKEKGAKMFFKKFFKNERIIDNGGGVKSPL